MISERILCNGYPSFWSDLLPWSDKLARLVNLSYDRYDEEFEIESNSSSSRAVVNEIGFSWFDWGYRTQSSLKDIESEQLQSLVCEAEARVAQLAGRDAARFTLTDDELYEARIIAESIGAYFRVHHRDVPLVISPSFPGCGFLDTVHGDVLAGRCIAEIKSGDRNFRSLEIRQILVYAALARLSEQYEITDAILLNPRRGIAFQAPIEWICIEAAGQSSEFVLSEIVNFVSGIGVSK